MEQLFVKSFSRLSCIQNRLYSVKIGCAYGFLGDTNVAAPQLIQHGNIDYLVFDYLSEITMSILTKSKLKFPNSGYAESFKQIAKYAKLLERKNIKVIANAGGVNTEQCARDLMGLLSNTSLKIATVLGDDISTNKEALECLEPSPKHQLICSNVYLGAEPIKVALDNGADIVITGRCADSSLILGPLLHKYQWKMDDYDILSAGSLAGHLLECGAQVTGGIFTDWKSIDDWWNIGFPIADVESNGTFTVSKPPNTGGLVSTATVSEQLVYELGDPSNYILPDVVCDFTQVTLNQQADNLVKVEGAIGKPPTDSYKVCSVNKSNLYRTTAVAIVVGKEAVAKSHKTAQHIIKRVRSIFKELKLDDFKRINIHVIGSEESYGQHKNNYITENVRESVLWIAAEHENKLALDILSQEIAPAGTGMAPGFTCLVGGRPKVSSVASMHSSLINKKQIEAVVHLTWNNQYIPVVSSHQNQHSSIGVSKSMSTGNHNISERHNKVKLSELAYCRSGDKADICNIGVVARSDEAWEIIRNHLTPDIVGEHMRHFFPHNDPTEFINRYEMPGIKALNFVMDNALGGGGVSSLNIDPQGKAYAQILLDLEI